MTIRRRSVRRLGTEGSEPGDLITSGAACDILGLEHASSFVRLARGIGLRCWHRSWSGRLLWSEAEVRAAFHVAQGHQRS